MDFVLFLNFMIIFLGWTQVGGATEADLHHQGLGQPSQAGVREAERVEAHCHGASKHFWRRQAPTVEGQDLCPVQEEGGQGRLLELPLGNDKDHRGDRHEVHYLRPGPVHGPAVQGGHVSDGFCIIH